MYAIFNENGEVIAFHDEEEICNIYIDNLYRFHKDESELYIKKIKKKHKHFLDNKSDLYLVRYGNTYIQEKYLEYLDIQSEQSIDDVRHARDVIYKIIETEDLEEKELRTLYKATRIMERLYDDCNSYTPTLKESESLKDFYDEIKYGLNYYDSF